MRNFFRTAFVVALLWSLASATSIVPMSVEELTAQAPYVVHAQAVSSRSAWDSAHQRIYTYTTFRSVSSMKGNVPEQFTVKQLGGSAGGYTMKVAGVHGWHTDEESVLFLRPSVENDGTLVVVGLMQGNYRVFVDAQGNRQVSNGVSDVAAVRAGQVAHYNGSHMSLEQLRHRVANVRRGR